MGERPDRGERNPSLSVSLTFPFSLSVSLFLSRSLSLLLCFLVLTLPESLAGWKTKWLMRVHSSCSLSPSLQFSNNIHSLFHFSYLKLLSLPSLHLPISPSFCLSPFFSLSLGLSVISESQPVSHAATAQDQAEYASVYFRPLNVTLN